MITAGIMRQKYDDRNAHINKFAFEENKKEETHHTASD